MIYAHMKRENNNRYFLISSISSRKSNIFLDNFINTLKEL